MIDHAARSAIVVETVGHGLCEILARLGVRAYSADCDTQALTLSHKIIADYVFADAVLPGMGGAALLEKMRRMQMDVYPGCVLTCISAFPASGSEFPLLTRPYTEEAVGRLLEVLLPENRSLPPQTQARISRLMDRLDIPDHPGRAYLIRAIGMTLYDSRIASQLSRRIYPALSKHSGVSPAQAERAIRHCIDTAWRNGSMEEQYRIFGSTIDAQRGKPTIAQMLARCADILRLEESL